MRVQSSNLRTQFVKGDPSMKPNSRRSSCAHQFTRVNDDGISPQAMLRDLILLDRDLFFDIPPKQQTRRQDMDDESWEQELLWGLEVDD